MVTSKHRLIQNVNGVMKNSLIEDMVFTKMPYLKENAALIEFYYQNRKVRKVVYGNEQDFVRKCNDRQSV